MGTGAPTASRVVAAERAFFGSEKSKESGDPDLDLTKTAQQNTPEAGPDAKALYAEYNRFFREKQYRIAGKSRG